MLTVGIKEIKNNPSIITKGVEDKDEYQQCILLAFFSK